MRKIFLMVAAAAAMLATSFTACKSNPPEPPELSNNIDIYVAGTDDSGSETAKSSMPLRTALKMLLQTPYS